MTDWGDFFVRQCEAAADRWEIYQAAFAKGVLDVGPIIRWRCRSCEARGFDRAGLAGFWAHWHAWHQSPSQPSSTSRADSIYRGVR